MNKRPRSLDHHQENVQQQPPQTRRMLDGMGCTGFVGSSSSGGLIRSMPLLVAPQVLGTDASNQNETHTPAATLATACSLTSTPTIIEREDSLTGSGSSARSSDSSIYSRTTSENEVVDSLGVTFVSKSKSADRESSIGGGSTSSSEWDPDWVCRRDGEEVDENELGRRMGYLQMRGFDKSLMDMMDESVYDEDSECSDEYRLFSRGYGGDDEPQHERRQQGDDSEIKVEVLLSEVRPQPVVITPERSS